MNREELRQRRDQLSHDIRQCDQSWEMSRSPSERNYWSHRRQELLDEKESLMSKEDLKEDIASCEFDKEREKSNYKFARNERQQEYAAKRYREAVDKQEHDLERIEREDYNMDDEIEK